MGRIGVTTPLDWPIQRGWACPVCGTTWESCAQAGMLFSFLWTNINGVFQCQGCRAFYALRTYDRTKTEDVWFAIEADDGTVIKSVRMPPDYVSVPQEATTQPWLKLLKYVWPRHKINLDLITDFVEQPGRPQSWLVEAMQATGITREQLTEAEQ